jgi:hypothetical protein
MKRLRKSMVFYAGKLKSSHNLPPHPHIAAAFLNVTSHSEISCSICTVPNPVYLHTFDPVNWPAPSYYGCTSFLISLQRSYMAFEPELTLQKPDTTFPFSWLSLLLQMRKVLEYNGDSDGGWLLPKTCVVLLSPSTPCFDISWSQNRATPFPNFPVHFSPVALISGPIWSNTARNY